MRLPLPRPVHLQLTRRGSAQGVGFAAGSAGTPAGIAFRPAVGAGQAAGIAFRHARSAGAGCQTYSPTALPTAAPGSTEPTAVPSAPPNLAPTTATPSAEGLASGGDEEKESADVTSLILIGIAIAVVSGGMVALLMRRQRKPPRPGDRRGAVLTGNPVFPAGGVEPPATARPGPAAQPEDQYDLYDRTYAEPADPRAYEVPQIYKKVDGSPVYEEAGPGPQDYATTQGAVVYDRQQSCA